jgi:hypothetical protein
MDGGSLNPRLLSYESPEGNYRITTSGTSNVSRLVNCSYGNVTLSATVSAKEWHHLIFTYGNSEVSLYIDGVKVADSTLQQIEALTYTTSLNIGRKAAPAYDDWGGKIDDILIYSRKLSDVEATQIYNASASLPIDGLIAYYPFTGNTDDLSGYNNNGINNGATLTTDRFGNANSAYYFNGSSNITVLHQDYLNLTEDFSISSWFNMSEYTSTYNASMILSKHDETNDGYAYGIWNPNHITTSQIVNFQANNYWNTATYPDNSGVVSTNKWYHYVVTFDHQQELLKYYLNGNLIFSKNIPFNVLVNNLPLMIGYSKSTSGIYLDYFQGSIDDIRIYNRVLDSTNIQDLYNECGYGTLLAKNEIKLTALQDNKGVKVNWTVESEEGISNYTLQRSIDGVHFSAIKSETAKGYKNGSYEYLDNNIPSDKNTIFYRIKINNKDGNYKYSSIAKVTLSLLQHISLYPNPSKNWINITHEIMRVSTSAIIINSYGVIVKRITLNAGSTHSLIDVSAFGKGVYFLKIVDGANQQSIKFIKE